MITQKDYEDRLNDSEGDGRIDNVVYSIAFLCASPTRTLCSSAHRCGLRSSRYVQFEAATILLLCLGLNFIAFTR